MQQQLFARALKDPLNQITNEVLGHFLKGLRGLEIEWSRIADPFEITFLPQDFAKRCDGGVRQSSSAFFQFIAGVLSRLLAASPENVHDFQFSFGQRFCWRPIHRNSSLLMQHPWFG